MRRRIGHDVVFFVLAIAFLLSLFCARYLVFQCGILFLLITFLCLVHTNKTFIVLEVISFFAVLQWLLIPAIVYSFNDGIYLMAVSMESYFGITLPSTILMLMGLFFPWRKRVKSIPTQFKPSDLGVILFAVGVLAYFIKPYSPGSLANVFHLLSYLIHVGFLYAFFSESKYKFQVTLLFIGFNIYEIAKGGMFNQSLLWIGFFAMLFFVKYKPKLRSKFLLGGVFLFSIFVVQSVKVDYRKLTWEDDGEKKNGDVFLLASLFGEKISNPNEVFDLPQVLNVLNRFNQGYIISHTYHHVPKSEPFANGETVLSAVTASAVPRILWPDKPKVGGGEIFPRFTGLELLGRTSANISPMGEAYVNFGKRGAMVFMFLFGLFLKFSFSSCLKLAQIRPCFLFWIPVIFLPTILLGTDLLSILNSITKSAIFIWGFYWSVLLFFKVRIF